MSMVHVVAVISTKPGMREQVLDLFRANVAAVKDEDGCIEYGATVDAEGVGGFQTRFGEDTFVVIEPSVLDEPAPPAFQFHDT